MLQANEHTDEEKKKADSKKQITTFKLAIVEGIFALL